MENSTFKAILHCCSISPANCCGLFVQSYLHALWAVNFLEVSQMGSTRDCIVLRHENFQCHFWLLFCFFSINTTYHCCNCSSRDKWITSSSTSSRSSTARKCLLKSKPTAWTTILKNGNSPETDWSSERRWEEGRSEEWFRQPRSTLNALRHAKQWLWKCWKVTQQNLALRDSFSRDYCQLAATIPEEFLAAGQAQYEQQGKQWRLTFALELYKQTENLPIAKRVFETLVIHIVCVFSKILLNFIVPKNLNNQQTNGNLAQEKLWFES